MIEPNVHIDPAFLSRIEERIELEDKVLESLNRFDRINTASIIMSYMSIDDIKSMLEVLEREGD